MYTSVNYHGTEDQGFVQMECAVPEPTQLPNSPQKVTCFLITLSVFYHKWPFPEISTWGLCSFVKGSDTYPRNQGYSCYFVPVAKSHVSDFCV